MRHDSKTTIYRLVLTACAIAMAVLVGCTTEIPPPDPGPTPECTADVDCTAANECADAACVRGACVETPVSGRDCAVDGGVGVCSYGECKPVYPCVKAIDCARRECADVACVDSFCQWTRRPNGWTCIVDTGASGICLDDECVFGSYCTAAVDCFERECQDAACGGSLCDYGPRPDGSLCMNKAHQTSLCSAGLCL